MYYIKNFIFLMNQNLKNLYMYVLSKYRIIS